jgi:pimeloyl-ACP methyl ester carboxylesterase
MRRLVFMLIVALIAGAEPVTAAEYRAFQTRKGVTVPTVIIAPDNPKAVAILFAGGSGTIRIQPDGKIRRAGNFLVASRKKFAKNGIFAVVIDAPSDQTGGGSVMDDDFRESDDHARDISMIVAALRKTYNLPVWLVGTSRGSTSVANAGIRLQAEGPGRPDGIVLTSAISEQGRRGGNLLDLKLSAIHVPTLVVHHVKDGCLVTPFYGVSRIKDGLTGARPVKLIAIKGGKTKGDPCGPKSHHGFLGQRGKVVKKIAKWIKAH